jgi:hypothetical protein
MTLCLPNSPKLTEHSKSVSRVFAALTAQPELDRVLQILKRIAQSQPVQP